MHTANKYTAADYINWRGDISFEISPFNEVDLFLCSQLVTPDFSGIIPLHEPGITLEEAASKYFECHNLDVKNLGVLQSDSVLPALLDMSKSVRYKNIILCGFSNYVDHTNDEQFCGLVIGIPGGLKIVTFRGTDDTLTGWKEDCNIAALDVVPAQEDALNYLTYVAEHSSVNISGRDIIVTGHSKGGNLAVYAACMAPEDVRNRIRFVVNWDGPGFRKPFFEGKGFIELNARNAIYNILSQNSLVGTLLESAGPRVFVNSYIQGPLAHDGFKWQTGTDCFVKVNELSKFSTFMEGVVKDTLKDMDSSERLEFINQLFEALSSTGAVTVSDFNELGIKSIHGVMKNVRTSPKVKEFLSKFVESMIKELKAEAPVPVLTERGIKFL